MTRTKGASHYLWFLWILTNRELKRKYKSTILGFLWILLNPLLQMLILTVVFSLFFKIKVKDYPIFALSGLLPWTFFAEGLTSATESLITNRDLIKKVPFPRELLPISSVLAHLITSSLAILLLAVFVSIRFEIDFRFAFFIPIMLLETALITGISLLLSSLDIYFRDVSFILQAILKVWFYATPIIYPLSMVPKQYLSLYSLNPMVGITTAFQSIFLKTEFTAFAALKTGLLEAFLVLLLGTMVFRNRAKYFADWI